MSVGASTTDAPDRGIGKTRSIGSATDDTTSTESNAFGRFPKHVELPSDEWIIYPPGKPWPANLVLRLEKTVPVVLVGIDSGDSPGVHVLLHPDGLSVSARFGGVTDGSVREFEPPSSDAERETVVAWTQTWVEHVDDRAEQTRIRTVYAPVPNAGDRVLRVLFDHFGSADVATATVFERNIAALAQAPGAAEQAAADLVVHYGTDAEWEHYRRHRGAAP